MNLKSLNIVPFLDILLVIVCALLIVKINGNNLNTTMSEEMSDSSDSDSNFAIINTNPDGSYSLRTKEKQSIYSTIGELIMAESQALKSTGEIYYQPHNNYNYGSMIKDYHAFGNNQISIKFAIEEQ
ncbi:hypothetical protein [Photobacterium leiognathi]|uniref:hypothetical protein n=1 Tax=Photobacterium leiognathi TaxID=553611 RepID=UPI002981F390|nr:hypothetical protein [Photobacterium leiognathi]